MKKFLILVALLILADVGRKPAAAFNLLGSTSWTATRESATVNPDGSQYITIRFTDSSDNHLIGIKSYFATADGSKLIDTSAGILVAAPVPSALVTAGASYTSQVDSLISTGVSNGKVKP